MLIICGNHDFIDAAYGCHFCPNVYVQVYIYIQVYRYFSRKNQSVPLSEGIYHSGGYPANLEAVKDLLRSEISDQPDGKVDTMP